MKANVAALDVIEGTINLRSAEEVVPFVICWNLLVSVVWINPY